MIIGSSLVIVSGAGKVNDDGRQRYEPHHQRNGAIYEAFNHKRYVEYDNRGYYER